MSTFFKILLWSIIAALVIYVFTPILLLASRDIAGMPTEIGYAFVVVLVLFWLSMVCGFVVEAYCPNYKSEYLEMFRIYARKVLRK